MPQMMPCSWLMIFLLSSFLFLIMNSNWSTFFMLISFPSKEKESTLGKTFWV